MIKDRVTDSVCTVTKQLREKFGKRTPTDIRQKEVISGRFLITKSELAQCCLRVEGPIQHIRPAKQSRTNTCFVFAHDFVSGVRYFLFFSLLTFISDSTKFLQCLLFTDGQLQPQHSNTFTKSVKRRILKHRKWRGKINDTVD